MGEMIIAVLLPRLGCADFGYLKNFSEGFVVGVEIPGFAICESDMKSLTLILPVKRQTALQLNTKDIARNVEGDEIGPVPVVGQPECDKSVIRQNSGHLLKIKVFLLARVEIPISDLAMFHAGTSGKV